MSDEPTSTFGSYARVRELSKDLKKAEKRNAKLEKKLEKARNANLDVITKTAPAPAAPAAPPPPPPAPKPLPLREQYRALTNPLQRIAFQAEHADAMLAEIDAERGAAR